MIEKDYTITNRLGMHARPASLFVKTTGRFQSHVKVIKDDQVIDGKSIMGLLMLAAGQGTPLKIVVEGPDENDLIKALDDLFARRFDDETEG
ncbi:MAG: HPr family phosphocarrier protein [Elusimicrobia bacterium]|nr:HPr family phosphocarrier protein [Candidatus Obscuribacterium magneticum]